MTGAVAEGHRDIAKLEGELQEQRERFDEALSRASQLDSFTEYQSLRVFAQEVLAKATPAFEAVDCLRAVIAKTTQLQDQADTKDTQIKAEGAPHGFTESAAL